MTVLLLAQLSSQRRRMSVQATQFGLFLAALQTPGMRCIARIVAFELRQLDLSPQGRQLCLLGSIGLAQITDFITTGIQLGAQTFLSQLRRIQTLIEHRQFSMKGTGATLHLP